MLYNIIKIGLFTITSQTNVYLIKIKKSFTHNSTYQALRTYVSVFTFVRSALTHTYVNANKYVCISELRQSNPKQFTWPMFTINNRNHPTHLIRITGS